MDVVTLGAALSIMKKMPDTAASSAAAAAESARTLTTVYESPFLSNYNSELDGIVGFKFTGTETAYGYRIKYFGSKNSTYFLFLQIEYKTSADSDTWSSYSNLEISASSAPSVQDGIIKLENTKLAVYLIPSAMASVTLHQFSPKPIISDNSGCYVLQNVDSTVGIKDELEETDTSLASRILAVEKSSTTIDSAFATSGLNSGVYGIKGLYVYDTVEMPISENVKYRLKSFIYGYGQTYDLYFQIQAYKDGSWVFFDSVEFAYGTFTAEDSMLLDGKYGRVKLYCIPSDFSSYSNSNVNAEFKSTSVSPVYNDFQEQISNNLAYLQYADFSFKDTRKLNSVVIKVDVNGDGDYTSIADAYAAITDSSFEKQYTVLVYPGTYNEMDLVPPKFTHTTGLHPNSVIVTGVGISNKEKSIFDLQNICKLSNMTIIANSSLNGGSSEENQNRYCVHFDSGIAQRYAICENLHLIKVYDATTNDPLGVDVRNRAYNNAWSRYAVGMGAQGHTNKIVFRNCTFENGVFFSHTQPNNTVGTVASIVAEGCQFVNAYIELSTLGNTYNTEGCYLCDINNCEFEFANNKKNVKLIYQDGHHAWLVSGSGNKNMTFEFTPNDGSTDEAWECVQTSDKRKINLANNVSVTIGKWVDITGNVADNCFAKELFGCAIENKSANSVDSVETWCGNAYPVNLADGEYGVVDGDLSSSASNKIGFVKNNILYRY